MKITLPHHLVLDLDGTLLDIRKKYYVIYASMIRKLRGTPLPQPVYWRLKRIKTPAERILLLSSLPSVNAREFTKRFVNALESERNLTIDTLFPFTISCLQKLVNNNHILYLVSARRNADAGYKQVTRLGISKYFQSIDIGLTGNDVVATKTAFLKKRLPRQTPFALVGDTEDDINAAKALGALSIAVTSGIRNKTYLKQFSPNLIVPTVHDLLDFTGKHK